MTQFFTPCFTVALSDEQAVRIPASIATANRIASSFFIVILLILLFFVTALNMRPDAAQMKIFELYVKYSMMSNKL